MTPYTGISVIPGDSVMLVDNWDDIRKRANIRPDTIVSFEADQVHCTVKDRRPDSYRVMIRTERLNYEVVLPYANQDHTAAWFSDLLDALDSVMMGARP